MQLREMIKKYPFLNITIKKENEKQIIKILWQIRNKKIPDEYPLCLISNFGIGYMIREKFIGKMGFALLSNNWIEPLSQWIENRKCLELMAGLGSLSYVLQQQGVSIIATDNYSWDHGGRWTKKLWFDVEKLDNVEALNKYATTVDIVIVSWAYMDDTAYTALMLMRQLNPKLLMIYIGEGQGGCTANNDFYENIEEVDDPSFYKAVYYFQRWEGMHDRPQLVK